MYNSLKKHFVPLLLLILLAILSIIYIGQNYSDNTTATSTSTKQSVSNDTLDTKWKVYINEKDGFQFSYPEQFEVVEVIDAGYQVEGFDYVVILSNFNFLPTVFSISVSWNKYLSSQESYVVHCYDDVREICSERKIEDDKKKIVENTNLSVNGHNAFYSTRSGAWTTGASSEHIIDIDIPGVRVELRGTLYGIPDAAKTNPQLFNDSLAILKKVAETIKPNR